MFVSPQVRRGLKAAPVIQVKAWRDPTGHKASEVRQVSSCTQTRVSRRLTLSHLNLLVSERPVALMVSYILSFPLRRFSGSPGGTHKRHRGPPGAPRLPRRSRAVRRAWGGGRAGYLRGARLQHPRASNSQRAGSGERTNQLTDVMTTTKENVSRVEIGTLRWGRGSAGGGVC